MRRLGPALVLFSLLMAGGPARDAAALAEPPRIGKPRPAPATPVPVLPLPPAQFDPTLAVGGKELKARKIDTRLHVEVQVNDRPYRFIVDSGADVSVIGLRIARALQLPLASAVVMTAMASRNVVDRVRVDRFTVGGASFRDLDLPALDETDLGGDGIIGIDALVQQRLLMDFDKRLIKVEDASTPVRSVAGEIVVVARRQRGQLILTHVNAAGVRLDAVVDTGTEVTIGNLKLRDRLVRSKRAKLQTVIATDVAGRTAELQLAVVPELQLGPITLRNVPIAFADLPPFERFGIADQPALLLGTDLLETFRRVSLDFRSRKIRFQLRRCGAEFVRISTNATVASRLSSTNTPDVCGR